MSKEAIATIPESNKAVATIGEMSVQALVDRKRKVVEVMNAVMREGEHYGKIPGCGDKPTLLKPGAEVLAMTFGLAPTFRVDRIDLPGGHREYQVVCTLVHIASGAVLAEGLGCGTTMEAKHRWRRGSGRVCPDCGKAAIIKGKAEFGGGWLCFAKKGGCGAKWGDGDQTIEGQSADRVENPDPADQYNTVLKMAKKRAQVDATLTATGASDLLTQDLDDLPSGSGGGGGGEAEDAEFTDRPPQRPTGRTPDFGLVERFAACTPDEFRQLDTEMRGNWSDIPKAVRPAVTEAFKRAEKRLAAAAGRQPKATGE